MNEKKDVVLILDESPHTTLIIEEVFKSENIGVIKSKTAHEGRLKFSNQAFSYVLINLDMKGHNAYDFIEHIRSKEINKNLKERVPILIYSNNVKELLRHSDIDNVHTLLAPFVQDDLKKKLLELKQKSGLNNKNIKAIQKDDYLIKEGENNNEMYWILKGQFIITKENRDNKNVIIGEANSGELLGEMSFLDNLPRSASVKATEDSEVLIIPNKKFVQTLDKQPRWFKSLIRTLSSRLRDADSKIAKKFI